VRRLAYVLCSTVLVSCVATPAATKAAATPRSSPSPAAVAASAAPIAPIDPGQEAIIGPGGMTLRQEIGAVMMVGFSGPLTPTMVADWRQRQFGGLLLLPAGQYAADPGGTRALIESLRGVMAHPLLAATDQAAGDMTAVAAGLKTLGFDIDFEPHVPVPNGQGLPTDVRSISAVVRAIHAAGMYSAFLETTPHAQDLTSLQAAIGAHADLVMASDVSVLVLRRQLGFQGVVISAALPSPAPDSAVRFLQSGGDMVLVPHDIATADTVYEAIHAAVLDGRYRRSQLDASVQKLLNLSLRFMP
jgi:glycosyl hydrolase family 3